MMNDQIAGNLVVLGSNYDPDNPVRMTCPPNIQELIMLDTLIDHNGIDLVIIMSPFLFCEITVQDLRFPYR